MSDYFLLDPDYKDFPEKQKLKFLTVYGEQHSFIWITIPALIGCVLIIAIMLYITPSELSYLFNGVQSQAIVTTTCEPGTLHYLYAYEVQDRNGTINRYSNVGDKDQGKACPKIGDKVTIIYLSNQPQTSRHMSEGSSALLNIGVIIFMLYYSYRFLHRCLDETWAYKQARPRFARLIQSTNTVDGVIRSVRDSKKVKLSRRLNTYYIEVGYEFVFNKRIFSGIQVKRREDLSKKPLPQPGTPVRVLYADENTYVML